MIFMYQKHFGLTERPFSIAPDPRFLYMSRQHREALAHLLYGIGEGGGFVQLTGEVGTGKTTICRCLLEQLPEHVDMALILNPRVSAQELLASVCDELKIPYARDTTSIKVLTDVLNAYLLDSHARGRRTVLMIDEAQNLSADALEQVRLLTNLETTREKLLQIILVGQPELRTLLARDDLRQLSQRITARYHLEPISREETAAYIRHRLQVCGAGEPVFNDGAIDLVHRYSSGIPRLINVLCDRAMLGAFVEGRRRVEAPIVRKAASEVLPEEGMNAPRRRGGGWFVVAAVLAALGMGAYPLFEHYSVSSFAPVPGTVRTPPPVSAPKVESVPPAEPAPVAAAETLPAVSEAAEPADTGEPVASPETAEAEIAKPASEPAASPSSDLKRALSSSGNDAPRHAWAGLYRLWGVQADVFGDEQACAQAPAVGLRCLQGGGSWTVLTQLDRPAILLLMDDHGRRVPVLLQELLGDKARIQVDGKEMIEPVDVLKQSWFGHYRVLWKTPPKGSAVLRPGDQGSDVSWLRQQLHQATGMRSIAPNPSQYDAGLEELVRSFQRDNALNVDGVAGPRTMIYLNTLEKRPSVPRLGVVKG